MQTRNADSKLQTPTPRPQIQTPNSKLQLQIHCIVELLSIFNLVHNDFRFEGYDPPREDLRLIQGLQHWLG